MEEELRRRLILLAETYAAAKGIELVTVARLAAGDWRFFDRIRSGSSFTARKHDEIVRWFWNNWPDAPHWPGSVPVPALHEDTARKAPRVQRGAA